MSEILIPLQLPTRKVLFPPRHFTIAYTPSLVLNWVEGIHREGDADPPQSVLDPEDDYKSQPPRQNGVYSPRPKSHNSEALRDLANSPVSYGGGGQRDVDHDSNVQNQSEPDNDPLPIVSSTPLIPRSPFN